MSEQIEAKLTGIAILQLNHKTCADDVLCYCSSSILCQIPVYCRILAQMVGVNGSDQLLTSSNPP